MFLTETRQIFWCGTNGDIKQQNKIKEFFYVLKIPDLFKNEFHEIIKLNHSFCRTSSILYRYEYIYYTKKLAESKIKTIIFISILLIISIESLNIFSILNLDGITYWSFDLFFLSYINLKLFGYLYILIKNFL